MSETLRACPACGGDSLGYDAWEPGGGGLGVACLACGTTGPRGDDHTKADAGWNALPRWEWHPAADPPRLPPGCPGVYVWAERKDGRRHPWWYIGQADLLWPDVARWHAMPTPPVVTGRPVG